MMKSDGLLKLGCSIIRGMEASEQGEVRPGTPGNIGVDDQRQNRMIEGSRGQFDLLLLHESLVQGEDFSHRQPLEFQYFLLVILGEATIFLAQRGQTRILLNSAVSEPCEIVPNLKIQQLLCGKLT